MTRIAVRLVVAAIVLLALAPNALASVGVGTNAAKPTLRVDAKGNAQVSYTQGREKVTVLVPATGEIVYGGTIVGRDVSKAVTKPKLTYAKVVRSGPHGWFYALQTWPARMGPVELRFSRWQGTPTKLSMSATQQHSTITLRGKVMYGGKAIPIVSRAPGGIVIREYVYLDQQIAGKWTVLGGVTVEKNGRFVRALSGGPSVSLFRASVAGPNVGSVYAPDDIVQIPPP